VAFRLFRSVAAASSVALVLIAGSASAALASDEPPVTETSPTTVEVTPTEVIETEILEEPVAEEPLPPAEDPPPTDTTSGDGTASKPASPPANPNGPVPSHTPVSPDAPGAGIETEPLPDTEAPPADTELEPDVVVEPAPDGETESGTESAVDSEPAPDPSPPGSVEEAPAEPLPAGPPAVDFAPVHEPQGEPVVGSGSLPPDAVVAVPGMDVLPDSDAATMPHTSSGLAGPATALPSAGDESSAPTLTSVVEGVRVEAGPTSAKPVPETSSHRSRHADEPAAVNTAAAAGASLAAGIVVVNRAPPASVAVAIEFGRAGGGWAGAIVFNLWLRRQLRERRMSQRQLAALSGVDHSTISRLLRQDRRPSLSTATKLVAALRHVGAEQADVAAADYFERMPEETVFPARRVELALRADDQLDDDQVRRLMTLYLAARRRHAAAAQSPPGTTIRHALGRDRR